MNLSEMEAEELANTFGVEMGLDSNQISVLKLIYQSHRGIATKEALAALPLLTLNDITDIINALSTNGLIRAFQSDTGLLFKGVPKEEVVMESKMTSEEMLIYLQIKETGTNGLWLRILKTKTGLHDSVVDKCIKSLCSKNFIKLVRSIKFPTRKIYMLWDLNLSEDMTGGPWYQDDRLEEQFVDLLYMNCFRIIARKSFPMESNMATGFGACYATNHEKYASAKEVHDTITKMQISIEKLTVNNIISIINLLVFDGKVVRLVEGKINQPRRLKADGDDDFEDEIARYKAVSPNLEDSEDFSIDPLLDIPCSGCVPSHLCYPVAHLSAPFQEQYKNWAES